MAWPNALALAHLEASGQLTPEFKKVAIERTRMGYQRVLSFQSRDGGFALFCGGPSEPYLTAFGLAMLADIDRAIGGVDSGVLSRAREYLRRTQRADGSWQGDPTITAYVAWGIVGDEGSKGPLRAALGYLAREVSFFANRPYALGLYAGALAASGDPGAASSIDRLVPLSRLEGESRAWRGEEITLTHAYSDAATVEATALAALALSGARRAEASEARVWLLSARGPGGLWYSTQGTVLALKALLAEPAGGSRLEAPREVEFLLDGKRIGGATLEPGKEEVLRFADLSAAFADPGRRTLEIASEGHDLPPVTVQLVTRYNVPWGEEREAAGALDLSVRYDRTELAPGETVRAWATVRHGGDQPTGMVLARLPVPPGFAPSPDTARTLDALPHVERVDLEPGWVTVYLDHLDAGEKIDLAFALVARRRGQVAVKAAEVWEYYAPASRAETQATAFVVR